MQCRACKLGWRCLYSVRQPRRSEQPRPVKLRRVCGWQDAIGQSVYVQQLQRHQLLSLRHRVHTVRAAECRERGPHKLHIVWAGHRAKYSTRRV